MYVWERDLKNRLVRKNLESSIQIETLDFVETLKVMEEQVIHEKTLLDFYLL